MLASFLLHRCNKMVNSVPQSTNKNCIWPVRNDYIQNMVSIISKSELYLVSAVRVVLGFQLWVCVSVEPMWVWWFGSNVYQMTMKRLLWLNNPEEILWLGSNLLSHEPQVDSQMAASVQNSLSLQETSVDWVLYCVSPPQAANMNKVFCTSQDVFFSLGSPNYTFCQKKYCLCYLLCLLLQHWSALICWASCWVTA